MPRNPILSRGIMIGEWHPYTMNMKYMSTCTSQNGVVKKMLCRALLSRFVVKKEKEYSQSEVALNDVLCWLPIKFTR